MADAWVTCLGLGLVVWWAWRLQKRSQAKQSERNHQPQSEPYQSSRFEAAQSSDSAYRSPPSAWRSNSSSAHARKGSPGRWYPLGEAVTVGGLEIQSGMIYVGVPQATTSWLGREHAHVVDPGLTVARGYSQRSIRQWPSYSELSPTERRVYLEWLAGGRCDPSAPIECVFLFFYGLEYRIFIHAKLEDAPQIAAEVERLLATYGTNSSFRYYAERFLDALAVTTNRLPPSPRLTPERSSAGELSLSLRVALAKRMMEGRLTGEWLLAWHLALPETFLRTPATRCFSEFVALFMHRFVSQYPRGLAVRLPAKRLDIPYRPSSGMSEVSLKGEFTEWPDPLAITAPLKVAKALVDECTDALDPLSRFLGRNPASKDSLAAAVLLPGPLTNTLSKPLETVLSQLQVLAPSGAAETTVADLVRITAVGDPTRKPSPSMLDLLSRGLALLGYAMEPDIRFGGKLGGLTTPVILFRADQGAPIDPQRPEYVAARVLVEVAVAAATVDAGNVAAGLQSVDQEIRRLNELNQFERLRLTAFSVSARRLGPNPRNALQKLASFPTDDRERIARVALSALAADRNIDPDEVRFAEKLYKALGLPSERLYSDLHVSADGSKVLIRKDDPPVVAPAKQTQGHQIPSPRPQPTTSIARKKTTTLPPPIDPSEIAKGRRTAAEIASLLTSNDPDDEGEIAYSIEPSRERETEKTLPQKPLLDRAELEQKRHDTRQVQSLISEVFAHADEQIVDESDASAPTMSEGDIAALPPSRFTGLDHDHAALVELLVAARGKLARATFLSAVTERGLFFDGALETINDWAYGVFKETLVDDADPLIIYDRLLDQLSEAV